MELMVIMLCYLYRLQGDIVVLLILVLLCHAINGNEMIMVMMIVRMMVVFVTKGRVGPIESTCPHGRKAMEGGDRRGRCD
mmetsp:Transcript_2708/g.4146  ORF Transcript_2708/g.4146 Transcript_2708/m.4146 type:complete len:80 (+) Transcript_2708:366-605(+)